MPANNAAALTPLGCALPHHLARLCLECGRQHVREELHSHRQQELHEWHHHKDQERDQAEEVSTDPEKLESGEQGQRVT